MDLGNGGKEHQVKALPVSGASGGIPDDGGGDSNDERSKSSEGCSSDIGSLDEHIVDPFALLEMWENIDHVDNKVDTVNARVGALNSKLDLVLKPIFEVQDVTPSLQEREQ